MEVKSMQITTSSYIKRNNVYQIQSKNNNINNGQKYKVISFSGISKEEIFEKFTQNVLKDILKDLNVANGPSLEIKRLPFSGIYLTLEGKILINKRRFLETPTQTAFVIRHEVKHFEQAALVARLPDGINRLWESAQKTLKVFESTIEKLKNRSIYTDFLPFRNIEKHKSLTEVLNRPQDYDIFRNFYEKVVEEKGILKPGSAEELKAEAMINPDSEYPNVYKVLLSFKDYKNPISAIIEKFKILSLYANDITEIEANTAAYDYLSPKSDFIKALYKQIAKEHKGAQK